MSRLRLYLFALLAAWVASAALAAPNLYPEPERPYATRAAYYRCDVTDANTALSIPGSANRGAKNLTIRNDGPSSVYVSIASTTASAVASAAFLLPVDNSLALGDFYTTGIGLKCSTGTTASVEVLATY